MKSEFFLSYFLYEIRVSTKELKFISRLSNNAFNINRFISKNDEVSCLFTQ